MINGILTVLTLEFKIIGKTGECFDRKLARKNKYDHITIHYKSPLHRGVIVIVAGNGHGDTSSIPGRD